MATAKRVAQDAKVEGGFTKEVREHFTIYSINGREIARKLVSTDTEVVDNRRFVLQPDRIVLDLSIEEAETVRGIMGAVGGLGPRRTHTSHVLTALETAGIRTSKYDIGVKGTLDFPASSGLGTRVSSSLGDACGLFSKYPKPEYAEPTSASR